MLLNVTVELYTEAWWYSLSLKLKIKIYYNFFYLSNIVNNVK